GRHANGGGDRGRFDFAWATGEKHTGLSSARSSSVRTGTRSQVTRDRRVRSTDRGLGRGGREETNLKNNNGWTRLGTGIGTIRCPHCGRWVGPEARQKTEEEQKNSRIWEAATLEELCQLRQIFNAIQARLATGEPAV